VNILMSTTWLKVAGSTMLVLAVTALSWHTVALARNEAESQPEHLCGDQVATPVVAILPADTELFTPSSEIALKPGPGEDLQLSIPFHRARGYRTESFKLEFVQATSPGAADFPPGTPLILEVSVIKRDTDSLEENPAEHMVYYALTTPRGVEAKVCFTADGVPPGRYQGTVRIMNFNITHSPIPLVVTLQEDNLAVMLALAASGVIGGSMVLYLQAQSTKIAAGGERDDVRQWLQLNWAGLILGIGAVWAVWNAQYLQAESFGASGTDYVAFVISCGAAFAGLGVAGSLGQLKVREHTGPDHAKEPDRSTDGEDHD
jgi:hypothetical protein